jgi:hypothetical protein
MKAALTKDVQRYIAICRMDGRRAAVRMLNILYFMIAYQEWLFCVFTLEAFHKTQLLNAYIFNPL